MTHDIKTYNKISAHQLIPENIFLYDNSNNIFQVEVDPIDYCNHNCKWCFTAKFREDKRINLFDLKNYLRLFCNSGGKSVVFSGGGEPLLYKELYRPSKAFDEKSICNYLISNKIFIGLITNGYLLNQFINSDFDVTKLAFIRISLDATSKKSYSKLHGTDEIDFEKIINNIIKLNETRGHHHTPATGISFVVDPAKNINFDKKDIDKICSLAKMTKVDFVQFKHIHTIDKEFAKSNMNKVHLHCLELDWKETEFWVQNYDSAKKGENCLISKHIQSVGNDSKRFPCCHHFGREEFLDQSQFIPQGKVIFNCKSKVCRYNEMNELLYQTNQAAIEDNKKKLLKSINKYGFHPYRYCPTAPEILKPFRTL